jgi:predicted peroxiredoxin
MEGGDQIMAKMLFIISNGFEKVGRATRAFQFAKVAREKGHEVKVFLIDDAIHWAQLGMAEGARASTGEEMKPFIDYLMGNGADMFACKA